MSKENESPKMENAPKPTEQWAKAAVSTANGVTVKLNGQKFQLPIQASTFFGMLAIGYQGFQGFHELQGEVKQTSENVVAIAGKLDDLNDQVEQLDKNFQVLEPELKALEKKHEDDVEALEERIRDLEACVRQPERCQL